MARWHTPNSLASALCDQRPVEYLSTISLLASSESFLAPLPFVCMSAAFVALVPGERWSGFTHHLLSQLC